MEIYFYDKIKQVSKLIKEKNINLDYYITLIRNNNSSDNYYEFDFDKEVENGNIIP